jgi:alpha-galactosidase
MPTITFIGAGSIGFTRNLLADILAVPELQRSTIRFTDINAANLDMVTRLCQRDIEANGLAIRIEATTDRRAALRDADYVILCVRIGGLDAFRTDVDIPLRYGVDQCVGDTLCAGGIMYGQRGVAAMLDFCKDIREVARAGCLLLNYANPNAMVTWAANTYGKVRCVGLCHGVQNGHRSIAWGVTHWARARGMIGAEEKVSESDIDIVAAGINHQTWYIRAVWRGLDLIPIMEEILRSDSYTVRTEKVRLDMLSRFGYFSTESNGHLSEYVCWYRKREQEIAQWIDTSDWIHGETGGYLRICTEGRSWFETDFPNWMQEPPKIFTAAARTHEHGSFIIESLETGRVYRGHFNVINGGTITNLPPDCVVEVPGYVDRNGLNIPVVGDLPWGPASICLNSINVQRLAVQAAVAGDDRLLRQAFLLDPLTGAVCNPPEVWQMVDEMLVAGEAWLPQYGPAIAAAKARLAQGLAVPVREGYQGSVRLHTKTVAEMSIDKAKARANASAADKAASSQGYTGTTGRDHPAAAATPAAAAR